jgi:hypothetical protein
MVCKSSESSRNVVMHWSMRSISIRPQGVLNKSRAGDCRIGPSLDGIKQWH